MLRKFLKSRTPVPVATIPAGQRVYAVGDVHGRLDLLDALLAKIDSDDGGRDAAETTLIFLGDLVDRGPDSAGVVERVRHLGEQGGDVRVLLGNHEEVFLGALDGDMRALKLFCRIGGRETALSYGINARAYDRMDYDALAAALAEAVPQTHREFLAQGSAMEVVGDYAFVHAGVSPSRPLAQQRGSDLRWIRDPFLDHGARLEKVVVHGHTIADEVEFRDHRIGIDTGAYATGRLTALALEDDRRWLIAAG